MKKIALISAFPPSRYNLGAPTTLPFQFLKYRPEDFEVDLYYYALPSISHRHIYLNDIEQLSFNRVFRIKSASIWKRKLLRICTSAKKLPRSVSRFPVDGRLLNMINKAKYDAVWLYPLWLLTWARKLSCSNIVVTGPDSVTLHSERSIRFGNWLGSDKLSLMVKQLRRHELLERLWSETNAKVHFVGEYDLIQYNNVTGSEEQAFWLRHPIPDYKTVLQPITKVKDKISVLISGGNNALYVGNLLDRLVHALVDKNKQLCGVYKFTFLGSGYRCVVEKMRAAEFDAIHLTWVPDYYEELTKHHIQIFPIAVGTGTKGKALNALATGLLGIGTKVAFENIAVQENKDWICFREPEETPFILLKVAKNRELFAKIAISGMSKVRERHSARRCSRAFWDKFSL